MFSFYQKSPYGIIPEGNAFQTGQHQLQQEEQCQQKNQNQQEEGKAKTGGGGGRQQFGSSFDDRAIPARCLAEVVSYLTPKSLCLLQRANWHWYALTNFPENWKLLAISAHSAIAPSSCGGGGMSMMSSSASCDSSGHNNNDNNNNNSSSFLGLLGEIDQDWQNILNNLSLAKKERREILFCENWKTYMVRLCVLSNSNSSSNFIHVPLSPSSPSSALASDYHFQSYLCSLLPPVFRGTKKETRSYKFLPIPIRECRLLDDDETENEQQEGEKEPRTKHKKKKQQQKYSYSPDDFRKEFEIPNQPCILRGAAKDWPLFKIIHHGENDEENDHDEERRSRKQNRNNNNTSSVTSSSSASSSSSTSNSSSSSSSSRKVHKNLIENTLKPGHERDYFRCEAVTMTLREFASYVEAQSANPAMRDERPIYLFSRDFQKSFQENLWTNLPHFARDDLFSCFGEKSRPDFRWLIWGAKNSGSSFHYDPNCTSAMNACLSGRKRWLMFPPGVVPPGIHLSEKYEYVTAPSSITEWFFAFFDETVEQLSHKGYEFVQEPGDVVFVPSGWIHCVINLEDSIAITQNFISEPILKKCLRFLRVMKSSISGIGEDHDEGEDDDDEDENEDEDEEKGGMKKNAKGRENKGNNHRDEEYEEQQQRPGMLTKSLVEKQSNFLELFSRSLVEMRPDLAHIVLEEEVEAKELQENIQQRRRERETLLSSLSLTGIGKKDEEEEENKKKKNNNSKKGKSNSNSSDGASSSNNNNDNNQNQNQTGGAGGFSFGFSF